MTDYPAPFLTNAQAFYAHTVTTSTNHAAPLLAGATVLYAAEAFVSRPATGLTAMVWVEEPYRLLWCVRSDGKAVLMTYRRDQDVVAWQRVETDGAIESLTVIPTANGASDEVWASIRRTINGSTVRYIERMAQPHDPVNEDDKAGAIYLDSCLTYSGVATSTLSGLSHLEGETVQVWGDGSRLADATVSGGQITLTESVTDAVVGLGYTSRLKTLRHHAELKSGSPQGRYKRIHRSTMRLKHSQGGRVGNSVLQPIVFRDGADPLDSSAPLFTGDRRVQIDEGFDREGQITLECDGPEPFTLTALIHELMVGDD